MSTHNPYDDYDAIDPWEDDPLEPDESGGFDFVEDEYDAMDGAGVDGLDVDPQDVGPRPRPGAAPQDIGSRQSDHTAQQVPPETFPKTMVRPKYVDVEDAIEQEAPWQDVPTPMSSDGVLRRRNRDRRRGRDQDRAQNAQAQGYEPAYQRPPEEPELPRRRRKKRHHGCLITLLLVIAVVVAAYWVFLRPIDERLAFSPAEQQTLNGKLSWSVPGMPYYLLALGSDAREGEEVSRTDTMLLVRVDMVGGKLTLVSIPRDTKVEIPGYGTSKINAAYAYEGAGGAVAAVSKLLGVPVNHVAVVHFEELAGLIDYLGGVTLNVPVGVSDPYTGVELDSGIQTLDGETAVLWARSRYGYEEGDVQRQEDQRILMTAIVNRMLSLQPNEIPGALDQIGNLIGTDMRCYNLLPLFLRFKLANPVVYSCAVPTTSAYLDNQWYEIVDDTALYNLMRVVDSGGDPSA